MYNYFMLMGTVCKDIEVKEVSDGKRVVSLILACQKPFAGVDGTRGTDFFKISLWEFLADTANENLKVGSRVAVKGRLLPNKVTLESGAQIYKYDLIGERIFFFSNNTDSFEHVDINPSEEEND